MQHKSTIRLQKSQNVPFLGVSGVVDLDDIEYVATEDFRVGLGSVEGVVELAYLGAATGTRGLVIDDIRLDDRRPDPDSGTLAPEVSSCVLFKKVKN